MSKQKEFVNPYHFIIAKDSVCERKKIYNEKKDTLTGYIDFEIETKTPLFIPNTSRQKKEIIRKNNKNIEHINLEFFSYTGKDSNQSYENIEPIIPGSSIRGMIRNIYETLTDSCLSVIDNDSILYKRTNDYYSHGLLKKNNDGTVDLYKADVAIINLKFLKGEFNEGQKVKFNIIKSNDTKSKNQKAKDVIPAKNNEKRDEEGYIIRGEKGFNKKNAHIFYCANQKIKKDISLESLKYVIKTYSSEKINQKIVTGEHKGYKKYEAELNKFLEENKDEEYFPVYYSEIVPENNKKNKFYYLSPACITKEVYNNSINDLLNKNGNYNPCNNKDYLCQACALFGMVGESEDKNKQADSVSSLIRIEDGILLNTENKSLKDIYHKKVTLQELSSPKISSTEFYLQKPVDADFWTYDYYVTKGKIYEDFPKISGRKFYWHHPKIHFPECEKTERNRTVIPVKKNVKFKSRLYFEDISEKQLKQLIWICNISSNEKLGYKLGMGKPLGLGSVKLNVKGVKIRSFIKDNKLGYYLDDYKSDYKYDYNELGFNKEVENAFKIICGFDSLGTIPVCYPISENQSLEKVEKGYEWFSYNRYKKGGKNGQMTNRTAMELDQYLENLNKGVHKLVANKKGGQKINCNNGSETTFINKRQDMVYQTKSENKSSNIKILKEGDIVEGVIKEIRGKKIDISINKKDYEVDLKKHKKFNPKRGAKVKIKIESVSTKGMAINTLKVEKIEFV